MLLCRLREVAGNRPERAEVGMKRIAGVRLNWPDERTAQQDFTSLHSITTYGSSR